MRFTIYFFITVMSAFSAYSEQLIPKATFKEVLKNQMCSSNALANWNSVGVDAKKCQKMSDEITKKCISQLPDKFPNSMIKGNDTTFTKCSCNVYEAYVSDIKKVPNCS